MVPAQICPPPGTKRKILSMLRGQTDRYATDGRTGDACFPDAVLDGLGARVRGGLAGSLLPISPAAAGQPLIPPLQARVLIVEALHAADPALADRAAAILEDPARLNMRFVTPGAGVMMRCRPARLAAADAPVPPDPERFAPQFARHDNPAPHAIIDYEYDGTVGGVIYLAHELGHALADGAQNENGFSYRTNPAHMQETQAYFVQHIAAAALCARDDPAIARAAADFARADMGVPVRDWVLALAARDALAQINAGERPDMTALLHMHTGADPATILARDEQAQLVRDAAAALAHDPADGDARTWLRGEAARLHDRPAAYLSAAALATHLRRQDPPTVRDTAAQLLGAHGPRALHEVLARAGIEYQKDWETALASVAAPAGTAPCATVRPAPAALPA